MKFSEDESYQEILLLIRLLTHILSKDYLDFSDRKNFYFILRKSVFLRRMMNDFANGYKLHFYDNHAKLVFIYLLNCAQRTLSAV